MNLLKLAAIVKLPEDEGPRIIPTTSVPERRMASTSRRTLI